MFHIEGVNDTFYKNPPLDLNRINAGRLCIVDSSNMQQKNTTTTKEDIQQAKKVIETLITKELTEESANADKEKDINNLYETMARDAGSQAYLSSEEQPSCSGVIAQKSTGTIQVMDQGHQAAVMEKKNASSSSINHLTSEDGLEALSNLVIFFLFNKFNGLFFN